MGASSLRSTTYSAQTTTSSTASAATSLTSDQTSQKKTEGKKVKQKASSQKVITEAAAEQKVETPQLAEAEGQGKVEETKEEKKVNIAVVFSQHTLQDLKNVKKTEKSAEELEQEKELKLKESKEKDVSDMEMKVAKHPKFIALQEKLNSRLNSRENKKRRKSSESKLKGLTGIVTYGLISIKNTASFLELSMSSEETTLKTLEDIHDLLDNEFHANNVQKLHAEIGKYVIVSKSLEDMINMAMKLQVMFNDHPWDTQITNLPMFRRLLRPEDLLKEDAVPLFNGPRMSINIQTGEISNKPDVALHDRFSTETINQLESMGQFAQGGQILVTSTAWTRVAQTQMAKHTQNRLGSFKLNNFKSGCNIVEVTPEALQERAKFYGSVCSYCAKGIHPWEKPIEKHDCKWHENCFNCISCNDHLSDGNYAMYQGFPHCLKCYMSSIPKPKCKKCSNNISKDYTCALGSLYHPKCFSCRQCSKDVGQCKSIYEYKEAPYCLPCLGKITGN